MSTFTVETRITHKYLMGKTKDELASEYMRLLDQLDKEQGEIEKYKKIEQERADFIRKTTGSPSLEHFIVRFTEMFSDLEKAQALFSDEILPYLNRQAMLADDGDALDLRENVLAWLKLHQSLPTSYQK